MKKKVEKKAVTSKVSQKEKKPAKAEVKHVVTKDSAPKKGKTILFVEPHNELAHEVQTLFGKNEEGKKKYNFLFAENAKETVQMIKDKKVDVVILDIVLPVISGYHLIELLKKHKQSVIIYTRLKHPDELGKMASMGADNIILKEFYKIEDLLAMIDQGYKKPMTEVLARIKKDIEAVSDNENQSKFSMLQCPKCNLILLPESHFCNNCGEKIIKEAPKALIEKPAEGEEEISQETEEGVEENKIEEVAEEKVEAKSKEKAKKK